MGSPDVLRIVTVGFTAAWHTNLRDALERYVRDAGFDNIEVSSIASVEDLSDTLERVRDGYFDLALCSLEPRAGAMSRTMGESTEPVVMESLRALHDVYPKLRLIVSSRDAFHAIYAFELDAWFLPLTGTYEDLRRVVAVPLAEAESDKYAMMCVRSAGGVDNVSVDNIQFVESSKRGPIIHLPNARTILARGTLQTLFERLSEAGFSNDSDSHAPFVKAGSSFIVNLNNVRASGKGALIFADGETIIVPVRKRKDVREALAAFHTKRDDG